MNTHINAPEDSLASEFGADVRRKVAIIATFEDSLVLVRTKAKVQNDWKLPGKRKDARRSYAASARECMTYLCGVRLETTRFERVFEDDLNFDETFIRVFMLHFTAEEVAGLPSQMHCGRFEVRMYAFSELDQLPHLQPQTRKIVRALAP